MPNFKDGVDAKDMSKEITKAFDTIDKIHREHAGRDATITSVRDGEHKEGSKHYSGEAIDLRTRDLSKEKANKIARDIQTQLGRDYDVVSEHNHIHVEYDKI